MNHEYILSIGAGKNQMALISEIKQMGFKCISCDLDANAPGKKLSEIFLNISTHCPDLIIEAIVKLKINLKAVLTRSTGVPVVTASIVAERFNLVALNNEIANILTHKLSFIKTMNDLNIPSPIIYGYKGNKQCNNLSFPVFVKPSKTNRSHVAMQKCNTHQELQKAYEIASKVSEDNNVNVEEYLMGQDLVSIDFVFKKQIIHLLTLGEISTGEPNFDGIGWYSCLKNGKEDKLLAKSFSEVKERLNIQNGFFQSAMKTNLDKKETKVYEIHAEIGGDLVNDIFIPTLTKNYNIFKNNILLSLNIEPAPILNDIKASILLFTDKINEYALPYEHLLIKSKVIDKDYVILFFKNHIDLKSYLNDMSTNKNFSINNYQ